MAVSTAAIALFATLAAHSTLFALLNVRTRPDLVPLPVLFLTLLLSAAATFGFSLAAHALWRLPVVLFTAAFFERACAELAGHGLTGHGLTGHGLAAHGPAAHGLDPPPRKSRLVFLLFVLVNGIAVAISVQTR